MQDWVYNGHFMFSIQVIGAYIGCFVSEVPAASLVLQNFDVVEESDQLKATWDLLDPLPASCNIQYGVKVESMTDYMITDQNELLVTDYNLNLAPCDTVKVFLVPVVKGEVLEAYQVDFEFTRGNIIVLLNDISSCIKLYQL